MVPMLYPRGCLDEILAEDLFRVQDSAWAVLSQTEAQILKRSIDQFLTSPDLKRIEIALDDLERDFRSVVQSSQIASITVKLERCETVITGMNDTIAKQQCVIARNTECLKEVRATRKRPMLTSFFVDSEEEMKMLRENSISMALL